MGTRADFYIGQGKDAEWLGSVAFDGYQWDENADHAICKAANADEFRKAVTAELKSRDDATTPEQGWPWPWADSRTTDYAYCFDDGLHVYCFGSPRSQNEDDPFDQPEREDWPDMTARQNVTFGHRSGMMIVSGG